MDSFEFTISYFSEVAAEVVVTYDEESVEMRATHPTDSVPIGTWFHFCDVEQEQDPLVVRGNGLHDALLSLAKELFPGVKLLVRGGDGTDEELWEQFVADLYYAFMSGFWSPPHTKYPHYYDHEVGSMVSGNVSSASFK